MKILLIHQYAGNKGDRAVAFAMCNILKELQPQAQIIISTSSPSLWKQEQFYLKNSIQFVPNSWNFKDVKTLKPYWILLSKIKKYTFTIMRELFLIGRFPFISKMFINPLFYKTAQDSDLIISVGGHHFTTLLSRDLVSSINYDAMSILSLKKTFICFSQSFGPFHFHNNRNKKLTYKILSNCSSLFVREGNSIIELKQFNIQQSIIHPTYESVISLNRILQQYQQPSLRKRQIGIAIYATQERSKEAYENYVLTMANSCKYFIMQGYKIVFFPMELKNTPPDDRILIKEVIRNIDNPSECSYIDTDMPTEEHIQKVAECQCFIGHKTHSTIFALASGTPLIAIAYHPKNNEFMKQFGVEQFCINDQHLSTDILLKKFKLLQNDLNQIGEHLFQQAKVFTNNIVSDVRSICQ